MSEIELDGRFEAQGRRVMRRPFLEKSEGGGRITMGFPLCYLTDFADDSAAEVIAAALNKMIDSGELDGGRPQGAPA